MKLASANLTNDWKHVFLQVQQQIAPMLGHFRVGMCNLFRKYWPMALSYVLRFD
jgi:hypothetical protein